MERSCPGDEHGTNGVTCYLWWARPTSNHGPRWCGPPGRMDDLLDVLTRQLHILLVLDQQGRAMRFTDLKRMVAAPQPRSRVAEGAQRARTRPPNGREEGGSMR